MGEAPEFLLLSMGEAPKIPLSLQGRGSKNLPSPFKGEGQGEGE